MRPCVVCSVVAVILLALHPAAGRSDTTVEFEGQVRIRPEGFDRSFQGLETETDIYQRTRLGARLTSAELTGFIQVQDARAWGQEASTISNEKNVDVFQVWGEVRKDWEPMRLQVRGGRQVLSYGNERILGAVDWSNIGRSFDALQVRTQSGAWTADVAAGRLRDGSQPSVSHDDDLYLAYGQYAFPGRDMRGEMYVMYRNDRAGYYETLPGLHFDGKSDRFRYDVEGAGMLGSRLGSDLAALLPAAQGHVRLAAEGRLWAGGGLDYLSGDDPDTADFELFDVSRIFHTGHKFYGLMDIAEGVAGAAGLIDPYLVLRSRGPGSLASMVGVHAFMVDQPGQFLVSGEPESDRELGAELDATFVVDVTQKSQLEIGGGLFWPGSVLKHQGRDQASTWAYVQGTVNF